MVGLYIFILANPSVLLPIYSLIIFSWLCIVIYSRGPLITGAHDAHSELSIPRASIFFQTYISIFAVDFSIYPLRFAKTETYGISLVC